ncbi:hypothetical protein EDD86DRAFT_243919 [Gorgonomyces haynaldii]|nr:hypothetical protein EDD86DRAFT_243919 [Gorgonomyces haynaldii]
MQRLGKFYKNLKQRPLFDNLKFNSKYIDQLDPTLPFQMTHLSRKRQLNQLVDLWQQTLLDLQDLRIVTLEHQMQVEQKRKQLLLHFTRCLIPFGEPALQWIHDLQQPALFQEYSLRHGDFELAKRYPGPYLVEWIQTCTDEQVDYIFKHSDKDRFAVETLMWKPHLFLQYYPRFKDEIVSWPLLIEKAPQDLKSVLLPIQKPVKSVE